MLGYDPSTANTHFFAVWLLIISLIAVILFFVLLYFNFLRILNKNKAQLSVGTYTLQKVLFKALNIQMLLAVIMLISPLVSSLVLTLFEIKWVSRFSLFAFSLTSLHAIADFVVNIFFIKNYRIFIKELVKKCLNKIGFKFQTPLITPMFISTTIPSEIVAPVQVQPT